MLPARLKRLLQYFKPLLLLSIAQIPILVFECNTFYPLPYILFAYCQTVITRRYDIYIVYKV